MKPTISEAKLSYFLPLSKQNKTSIKVPESHNLHVAPSACSRRNAIHALERNEKEQISCLYITEADVVSGHYEEIIGDAVADLLEILEPTPRVFLIYVKCIDDFLGTDEQALLDQLDERFPSLRFKVCHINPVAMDKTIPPGLRIQSQLYSFLDKTTEKDNGINFVGNFVDIDENCELHQILRAWGITKIRQLFDCKTYDQYQELARSKWNLVLKFMGVYAAENMEKQLDIPCLYNPISYRMEQILIDYQKLADFLQKACPDFQSEIEKTKVEIQKTVDLLADYPIVVGGSATPMPHSLARALCEYGLTVKAVFKGHMRIFDPEDKQWLEDNYPDIRLFESDGMEALTGYGMDENCIALGYDATYVLKARHSVNILNDDSFYGFYGVQKLMRLLRKAYQTELSVNLL